MDIPQTRSRVLNRIIKDAALNIPERVYPVALAYVEAFDTKSEAMKREAALKKLTRSEKQDLILGFAGPCAEKIMLRHETEEDRQIVEELTREAFWNVHEPGCSEHYLAHIMRDSELFLPELDFVAEINGKIVGNIMYMRSSITDGDQTHYPVITFGPISVLPKEQGKGVGSKLIEHTLKLATDMGLRCGIDLRRSRIL